MILQWATRESSAQKRMEVAKRIFANATLCSTAISCTQHTVASCTTTSTTRRVSIRQARVTCPDLLFLRMLQWTRDLTFRIFFLKKKIATLSAARTSSEALWKDLTR